MAPVIVVGGCFFGCVLSQVGLAWSMPRNVFSAVVIWGCFMLCVYSYIYIAIKLTYLIFIVE